MPLLRRPHGHHRDIPARRLAALSAGGINRRNQDRYIMIEVNSRRHPSAALLYRCLLTGNDQAHPRAARNSRPVVRSLLRDAGSACRDWPKCSPHRRLLPRETINAPRQQAASVQIPIASDARPRHTSRGFLPWRFAYAGPSVRRTTFMGPPSANLHKLRHESGMSNDLVDATDFGFIFSKAANSRSSTVDCSCLPNQLTYNLRHRRDSLIH